MVLEAVVEAQEKVVMVVVGQNAVEVVMVVMEL
jgi:hypothetical protein